MRSAMRLGGRPSSRMTRSRGEDQRERDRDPEQDEAEEDCEQGDDQRSAPGAKRRWEALDEEQQHRSSGDGHADVDPDHREAHREGEAGDSEPRVVGPVPQEHDGDDGDESETEGDEALLDRRREVVREHVGDEVAVAPDPEAGPEEHHPDEAVDRDLLRPGRRCEEHVPGEDLDEDRRHHDGEENGAGNLEDEVDEIVEPPEARPLRPRVRSHSPSRRLPRSRSTQGRPCRVKRACAECRVCPAYLGAPCKERALRHGSGRHSSSHA